MTKLHGWCDPRFDAVRAEFARNLEERGELGAAVALHLDGAPVIDLWGGIADPATARPWAEDTMVVVFSCTKGLSALCLHMLADRGLIDFEAPVARYWPQFAAGGKAEVTVAAVLSHQAGLPWWDEPLPPGALFGGELAAGRLAAQAPAWEPGTRHGYHAVTLGLIEGELVRRVTGRTIGRFLREEVAEPLDADVWIGLPEEEEPRVAPVRLAGPSPHSALQRRMQAEPAWSGWRMVAHTGGDITRESVNSRARHAAESPAAGGIASARGLARVYAPLAGDGSAGAVRLVSPQALPGMRMVRAASDRDEVLQIATAFTLGFSKSWGARRLGEGEYVILGEHAFGAPGLGGSLGFADGQAGLSFGYVCNRHGPGVGLNARGQSLVDAAYRALGFGEGRSGVWTR